MAFATLYLCPANSVFSLESQVIHCPGPGIIN
jgi:hypothetical protein